MRLASLVPRLIAWNTLLLLTPVAGDLARAEPWVFHPGEEQRVGFRSKAPLESFEGSTHIVNGTVVLDPTSIRAKFALEIRVDLASLDTGLSLRNRHMRENHLHTDRFPVAVFRGVRVLDGVGIDLRDGAHHDLRVEGELDLHGVVRPLTVTLDVQLTPGLMRFRAEFPVALHDHDIPRPRFLFAKLGKVQQAFVDIVAVPAPIGDGTPTGTNDVGRAEGSRE